MTTVEILQDCTIEGNNVKLPNVQLDRKQYLDVAKSLEGIGGKWKGGKTSAFVFNSDPVELLSSIQGGQKVNLKKDFQFFATPDKLAGLLVHMANVNSSHLILEPSAGQGAIVKLINRYLPGTKIDCCELMPQNRLILQNNEYANIIAEDFLKAGLHNSYDRIIANPPFSKNQDIDHIYEMWECLKEGGRIVTIASNHWRNSENKKELSFTRWLKNKKATIHEIEAGAFKESGTNIAACIIVIDK